MIDFVARTTYGTALDLGCGNGTNAITLARHGWRITGVDFMPDRKSLANNWHFRGLEGILHQEWVGPILGDWSNEGMAAVLQNIVYTHELHAGENDLIGILERGGVMNVEYDPGI